MTVKGYPIFEEKASIWKTDNKKQNLKKELWKSRSKIKLGKKSNSLSNLRHCFCETRKWCYRKGTFRYQKRALENKNMYMIAEIKIQ